MKRIISLILVMSLAVVWKGYGQTVTYVMQDANFPTQFNDGGDFFNPDGVRLGMWANNGNKNTVAWRTFKTAGDNTGSNRNLQIGDIFKITISATRAFGQIGFSLNSGGTQGSSFANRISGSRLYFNTDNYAAWYVNRSGGNSSLSYAPIQDTYKDYIFTIRITSQTTADVFLTVDATDYRAYNLTMNGTAGVNIDAFSVYGSDMWDGSSNDDAFWKQTCTVESSGRVELGYYLTGGTYNPGIIGNGLESNNIANTKVNDVFIGGDAGSAVILDEASTYSGATTINANATARASNATAFGTTAGGVTVTSGGILELSGSIAVGTEALSLSGTGISSAGALRNTSGTNSWSGAITLGAASRINSDAGTLTLSGGISGAGQNLTVGGAGNVTIDGVIGTTTGTLTKDGAGTLTLSNANTYSGTTTISAGTIGIGHNSGLGTGSLFLTGGTIFSSGASRSISNNVTLLVNGGTITGTNDLFLNGTLTNSGGNRNLTVNNTGNTTLAGNVYLSNTPGTGRTLIINGSGSTIMSGVIADFNGVGSPGSLTYSGTGTLTLSNSNTYTGNTSISAGTLRLGAANSIPDASNIVLSGGTLSTGSTIGFSDVADTLSLTGSSFIALGTGVHSLKFAPSNTANWSGTGLLITGWVGGYNGTTGSQGKIYIGDDNINDLDPITQLAKIFFTDGTYVYTATQLSDGEIVPLALASLYWTGTSGGTWTTPQWNIANSAGFYPWVNGQGAIFYQTNGGITVGSNINTPSITATANTTITPTASTTIGTAGQNTTINVSGAFLLDFSTQDFSPAQTYGITKNGTGTLALSGGTYGGGFTLNAGTAVARSNNAFGGHASGNTLTIAGGTLGATGNLDFSGKFPTGGINISGNFTLGTGTSPAAAAANLTFDNAVSLGNSVTRTLSLGGTGTYTFGGAMGGTSSNLVVSATAAGTLVLSGSNIYNGTTTINSPATLQYNGSTAMNSTSAITLAGGTLAIGATPTGTLSTGLFNMTGSSTITLVSGTNAFNLSFSGFGGNFTGTLTINGWDYTKARNIILPGLSTAQLDAINFTGYGTGARYSLDVPNMLVPRDAFYTKQTGDWNETTTWLGGVIPPASSSVTIAHAITVNGTVANNPSTVTIATGGKITWGASGVLGVNTTFTNGGNGVDMTATGRLNMANGSTFANGTIANTGTAGYIIFNGTGTITGTGGTLPVVIANGGGITFPAAVTIGGAFQINTGGFALGSITYGTGSTLIYNASSFTVSTTEWSRNVNSGTAVPWHVQVGGGYLSPINANITVENTSQFRQVRGNFTLVAGSTFTLGGTNNGNLLVAGDFTNFASTNFNSNGRIVIFNGTGNQNISGTTTLTSFNNTNASGVVSIAAGTTISFSSACDLVNSQELRVYGKLMTTSSTSAIINNSTTTNLVFAEGSEYEHARTTGTIPLATWTNTGAGSTCRVTGTIATGPTINNPATGFSHFIWEGTLQTGNITFNGQLTLVKGNFTINSMAAGSLSLADTESPSTIIEGNFEQNAGTFYLSYSTGLPTLSVSGSFAITNTGIFNLARNGTGTGTLKLSGSLTQASGATITEGSSSLNNLIEFTGSGIQTVNLQGTVSNLINFRVNNSIATAGINITGNPLTLNSNASFTRTLGTVTGSINYTGLNTLFYDNTAALSTQTDEWPSSGAAATITMNGSGGLTLGAARNFGGTLTLTQGIIKTTATNLLTVTNTSNGAVTGGDADSYINGPFDRYFTSGGASYSYPVGTASQFLPVTLSGVAYASGTPVIRVQGYDGPTGGSFDNNTITSLSTTEYWQVSTVSGPAISQAILGFTKTGTLGSFDVMARSNSGMLSGEYVALGGSPSGGNSIVNVYSGGTLGYFVMSVSQPVYYWTNAATMNWSDAGSWLATHATPFNAPDAFIPSVSPNAGNSKGITVRSGHNVTLDVDTDLDQAVIMSGGTLTKGAGALTIADGTGVDLDIYGNFIHSASPMTAFSTGSNFTVRSAGLVKVGFNTGSAADYAASANVYYEHNAVFEWAITNPFNTAANVYFQNNNDQAVIPIFRTSQVGSITVGSVSTTEIRGIFEANSPVQWSASGVKTFRNGIRGSGIVSQSGTCGQFRINGTTSQLGGGTLTLRNDVNSGLALQSGTCNLIAPLTANTGPIYIDNGATLISDAVNNITGTASFTLNSGATLSTAHASGVDGTITLSNLSMNSGSNYIFNGTGNQATGSKMAANPGIVTITNTGIGGSNTVTLSNDGTTATTLNLSNGLFAVGSGKQFNIAANGTVNATSGSLASGDAAGTLNFKGTGTVNATGTVNFWNVTLEAGSGGVDFGSTGTPTIVNEMVLNNGRFVNTNAPFYGSASTLVYNTGNTFVAATEWYTFSSDGRGIPNNVQIGRAGINDTKLNFDPSPFTRQCSGNVSIGHAGAGSGYGLILSSVTGGDLSLRGNWNRYANGTFTPNGRAVTFNGTNATTPNQTISVFGSGTSVEVFHYLIVDNNATNGSVSISNTAGAITNVSVDGNYTSTGYQLQLLGSSPLNLNQRTLYIAGVNGGGVQVSGGIRNITGTAMPTSYTGGYLVFQKNKTIYSSSGGSLVTDQHTTVRIEGISPAFAGVDFGNRLTTIQGRLELREGSYVDNNAPFYSNTSLLQYNTGNNASAPYYRDQEWTGNTTLADPGFPNQVQISGNTYLVPGGDVVSGNDNTNIKLQVAKSLTIDAGSTFDLDFSAAKRMKEDLVVGDSLNISGTLTASQTAGADIFVGGNWYRGGSGTFTPNLRIVHFNGSAGNQLVTNASAGTETFAYWVVNKSNNQYVKINNSPATTVTLTGDPSVGTYGGSNTGEGNVLEINAGGIDLNGQNFNLGGNRGFLHVTGGLRNIISTTTANFYFNGYKEITTTPANAGTLEYDNQVIVHLGGGVNFGRNTSTLVNLTTINATLQINANGYADIFAPYFGPIGKLVYNNGGQYMRRVEWRGEEGQPGYPNDVIVQNNSTLIAGGPNGGENINNPLSARRDVTIQAGSTLDMHNFQDMNKDLVVGRNLTINGNLTSSQINNINIQVGQDWVRGASGVFNQLNNSMVIFNTGNNGVISNAGGTETFTRVKLDKTGGAGNTVTLQRPVNITDNIDFTGGLIVSDATNILKVTLTGTATKGGNTSFVNGPMAKETNNSGGNAGGTFIFPVGKNNAGATYRPVALSDFTHDGANITTYSAEYRPQNKAAEDFNVPDYLDGLVLGNWKNQWWELSKLNATAATARLGIYNKPGQDNWVPTTPLSGFRAVVAHYNSLAESWEATKISGNFNDSTPTNPFPYPESRLLNVEGWIYSDALTTFSPFTLAFGSEKVLPLRLLTFTATLHGPDALLHWTLADAKDLKGFEVEHSNDGQIFTRLAGIASNGGTDYNYRHIGLLPGVHYYRLKMMEKDGRSTYSKVEVLMLNTSRTLITGLLQNPIQGGMAVVKMFSAANQDGEAVVFDMAGRTLLRQKFGLQTGYNQPTLSLLPLPAGMYKLLIRTRDGVEKVLTVVK